MNKEQKQIKIKKITEIHKNYYNEFIGDKCTYKTYIWRIYRGLKKEEAIQASRIIYSKYKLYYDNYKGEKCLYKTFSSRIHRNIPMQDAIKPKRIGSDYRDYYNAYEGKKCKFYTYLSRIRYKYMSLEDAIQPCSFDK